MGSPANASLLRTATDSLANDILNLEFFRVEVGFESAVWLVLLGSSRPPKFSLSAFNFETERGQSLCKHGHHCTFLCKS